MFNIYSYLKFKKKINSKSQNKIKNEHFDFDFIGSYFHQKKHNQSLQIVNDRIINDIDIHEFFTYIDRTTSKVGQQFLFDKILTIPEEKYSFEMQEQQIQFFTNNITKTEQIRKLLSYLNKKEAYNICDLFLNENAYMQKPKWFFIIPILSALSGISLILTFFFNKVFILLLVLSIINIFIHYWNKRNIFTYINTIPQLLVLYNKVTELIKLDIPYIDKKKFNFHYNP